MAAAALAQPVPLETLGLQMMAITSFDSYDRLPQIKAKTLVIHGGVDMLVPPQNGKTLSEQIPGAELRMLAGAAHMFFWEEPQKSAAMVTEFLSRVPASA
jgi:pimeloyl-ACP methyl ester carboxylesterase